MERWIKVATQDLPRTGHPYLRDLCTSGEAANRIERFHERLRRSTAGDVILMHPLLLHAPPTTHLGSKPRFLLNKDIYL
jgi:hypothetical protein